MNRQDYVVHDEESGELLTISYDQKRIWDLTERPRWATGYRNAIKRDDHDTCYICGQKITDRYEIDHVNSWSDIRKIMINDPELWQLEDSDIIDAVCTLYFAWNNLRATHPECNRDKGSDSYDDKVKDDPDANLYTERAVQLHKQQRGRVD